jgi:hypothetical protein
MRPHPGRADAPRMFADACVHPADLIAVGLVAAEDAALPDG